MFFKKKPAQQIVRGRTIRASQHSARSGQVFSYHANRSVRQGSSVRNAADEPQEAQPKRRKYYINWRQRLSTYGMLAIILVITYLILQLNSNAKVQTVDDAQGHVFLRSSSIYRAAARHEFASFFNSNKLTVNTAKIASDLKQQFPELKEVSVSLPMAGTQPTVYLMPATPRLVLSGASGSYLLDSDGRAIILANQVPSLASLHVPVITDQSGLTTAVGQIALPQDSITFITEVIGQLQAKGLKLTSVALPAGTEEMDVHINGVGYFVKFNLHGDGREEAGAYLAVKGYLESNHKTPGQYVDVRVENRAYYR